MSFFSKIVDKIFHRDAPAAPTPRALEPAATAPLDITPAAAPARTSAVNIEDVLSALAEAHGGGGNWRTSIVDLLKLLQLDSSLDARKQLAEELGVQAGAPGSAEQNVALHKAVMRKLVENGGIVPDSLYM